MDAGDRAGTAAIASVGRKLQQRARPASETPDGVVRLGRAAGRHLKRVQHLWEDINLRFDARYLAFVAALEDLRPRLHRYCARMTGSVFDAEDIAQEAIFEAYRKLEQYDTARPLAPWLVRIAHNRCIDFIRRQRTRAVVESESALADEAEEAAEPSGPWIGRALERLVTSLPPKERACILLKDVFDYSLGETADLVGSTVGGVKSALKRGRTKLASPAPAPRPPPAAETPEIHCVESLIDHVDEPVCELEEDAGAARAPD